MNPTDTAAALPSLDLIPSDEERLMRESVYGIVSKYGPEYNIKQTRDGAGIEEVWTELGEAGFLGVNVPEEYGGGGGGLYELAVVCEEAARAGVPMLPIVFSPAIAGNILVRHGSEEQKQRWLTRMATGELKISFAITEPDAGTNSHQISTRAKKDGNGWRLHGTKTYISGVEDAELLLVVARTGETSSGKGLLSLFVIPTDAEGMSRDQIPTALGGPDHQWTLSFDGVYVEEDCLIGDEHEGLKAVFDGLNPERVTAAAMCNGIALYALEKAAAYANERNVWGVPIGAHQGVSHPLAEAKIHLEHGRLMTEKAGKLYDAGAPAAEASNMAKFMAADAATMCVDRAIQAHGGNGVALEYELSQYWWPVRLLKIAPVSREMILNFVAQTSLGLPRSY